MITIRRINGYWAQISGLTTAQAQIVSDALSYADEEAERDWRFTSGLWDGRIRLLSDTGMFPAGMLKRVMNFETHSSFHGCEFVYTCDAPTPRADIDAVTIPLRDYQRECVSALLEYRCGIGEVATGGGKSRCAVAATEAILRPNPDLKALIIVPTSDIRRQMVDMIEELLGRDWVSELTESAEIDTTGRFLVATASLLQPPPKDRPTWDRKNGETKADYRVRLAKWEQLLATRTDRWEKYKEEIFSKVAVLIVDEAHKSGSETWSELCMACDQAYWRFGWTGTAFREDGADLLLEAATGPVCYTKTPQELVDMGFLVRPDIYMVRTPIYTVAAETFRKLYNFGIIEHSGRNKLIHHVIDTCLNSGRHTLVLVKEDKHGQIIKEMLGDRLIYLTGKTSKKKRIEIIDAFRRKEIPALMATTLADEGLDVPAIDAVVFCGGGQSDVKTTQRAGRVMRLYPGKANALIFDFEDSHNRLLNRHAMTRGTCLSALGYPVYSWEVSLAA